MFTLPDKGTGANDLQSILFAEYLKVLVAGVDGLDCVLSGLAVTAQGSPNMTVAVAKGSVLSNGTLFAVAASASLAIGAADGTNPRLDLVVVNASGTLAVRAGTAAASPKPPTITANDVVLAAVYVPATDTTIASNQITDLKMTRTQGPVVLKKTTTPVTFNTTLAIQTYFSLTVPDGLFLAGKVIRVSCGGTYLANSATPTFTLTISYGGTTMFADVTGATTNDTDRGVWQVEFMLVAQGNSDQDLTGWVSFQTPGAKTAAASGQGDLSVTTHIGTPLHGASAVDSNAANRDLLVRWTMSVSNVANEVSMDYGTAELL